MVIAEVSNQLIQTEIMVIVGGFVVAVISVVASAVWAVSRIDKTTAVLGQKVTGLGSAVEHLATAVEKIDDKTDDHANRITRLEATRPIGCTAPTAPVAPPP